MKSVEYNLIRRIRNSEDINVHLIDWVFIIICIIIFYYWIQNH